MFLYKTFRNLYKTEYFLYKNRRRFLYVFQDFFRSVGLIFMFFPVQGKKFFCPFSSFSHFFRDFPAEKSAFSGMDFPSERTFFPFLGEYFRIFFSCHPIKNSILPEVFSAPSGRNFHLSGSFLHEPDARALARA